MNKFKLVGEILNAKPVVFPSGKAKITFSLKAMISQKQFTFLNCESWNQSWVQGGIQNGMIVELTNYIPQTQTWLGQQGQKQYKQIIVVNEIEVLRNNSILNTKEIPKENIEELLARSTTTKPFDPNQLDWMNDLDQYAVEKEKEPKPTIDENEYQLSLEQIQKINETFNHPMRTEPSLEAGVDKAPRVTDILKGTEFER